MGTVFEGETILVLGVLAAHRGYLDPPTVAVCAYCGAILGDQLAFHLGRWRGERLFARFPQLGQRVAKARGLVDRYRGWLAIVFRLTYGLRVVLPIMWGMGTMPAWRFLLLDAVGVTVWVSAVFALSWSLGVLADRWIGEVEHYETIGLLGVIGVAGVIWLFRWQRARRDSPP